ncbi:MAG: signal peptide peptidase SppA [Verrucomicrobiae bacterium]|nr:signal peptide peptidase SppA [Verrucomicrobiae bacterium]
MPCGPAPGRVDGPPAPKRSGISGWWWVVGVLVVLGIGGVLVVGYVSDQVRTMRVSAMGGFGGSSRTDELREVVLRPAGTRNKIVVMDLTGIISGDPWDYMGNTLVTHVERQLERAAQDPHVKAVVVRVDSPGGEVLASDEIYQRLQAFQERHDKPMVASMGRLAASGGYYVAAPCQWIVAHELTITGSIGVIMQGYNWRGLMDKVGVSPQVFKSGDLKDMLSPSKREEEITSEERRIVQDLVNETFERFKSVVEEGRGLARARNEDNSGEERDRGRALARSWEDYADGRLLSGKEAWTLGMVDELGNFDTAVERARRLAGIQDARLVQYLRPMGFGSLFRLFGQGEEARVTVDLGIAMPNLRAGLYFLAPELVR